MTSVLAPSEVARQIAAQFPDAVEECTDSAVFVKTDTLVPVMTHLKNSPDLAMDYLIDMTSVDYYDYFEVVYQVGSLTKNHRVTVKTRCLEHDQPVVPSLTGLWRGANFMEREIYDLMGIAFSGHPNLKRIVLWEGFEGHPLRKDYL